MASVIQGYFPHGLRGTVQRMGTRATVDAPAQLAHMPQVGGQPLPPAVLQRMESAFGASFADVRVHVGPEAAAIGAVAFTRGSHIHFAPGQYNPATPHGQRILGHELAHVVQQRSGRVRGPIGNGTAIVHDTALEAEAERASMRVATQPQQAPPLRPVAQPMMAQRAAAPPQFPQRQPARPRQTAQQVAQAFHASRAQQLARSGNVAQPFFGELWNYSGQLWNSVFGGQQQQVQPPPEPTAEELHERLLRTNRERYRDTARPGTLDRNRYNVIDSGTWGSLTHFHGRASNRRNYSTSHLVRGLFRNFVDYGFRYSLMGNGASSLIEHGRDGEASCLGMARVFTDLLNAYGIEADAQYVRREDEGRFLVRVENFIDPNVKGHIYDQGVLKRGYYMFTSHAAVWVPSENLFYDPMAKTSYASIDPYIECELDSNDDDTEFTPSTQPRSLRHHSGHLWKLSLRPATVAGGFRRVNMIRR